VSAELADPEPAEVVALHGGIGTGAYHWGPLADWLGDGYRVHLPDLPGHGSAPIPDGRELGGALLTESTIRHLGGFEVPPHVAGFSLGGQVALAVAAQRPELFGSLALVGVSLYDHAGLRQWRDRFDPDRLAKEYPLWARKLARLHEPLGGRQAWRDVCRRDAAGVSLPIDTDALTALTCPVLLVRGDRDPAADAAQYAELRRIWPEAEELVVPAGGHDVQLTRQELVGPALRDFLNRAGRRA
jgi:pimeloyl-ACP methyl ester carboxylesterase